MSRPPIIALIGVDGSGKTTQARRLARWLTESGRPASYFENAGGRPVLDGLAHRFGRRDGRDLLGRGYVVVESTVRWVAISRALILARRTGRIPVMDRYTYCQYAVLRARAEAGENRARALFGRFPVPDLVCFLSVPARTAQVRVELRGRDREELAYLEAFDQAYRSLPEYPSFRVVPAGGTVDQVQAELRAVVQRELPG